MQWVIFETFKVYVSQSLNLSLDSLKIEVEVWASGQCYFGRNSKLRES